MCNTLPKDLAIQLMPTDDDGKLVVDYTKLKAYIKVVLQYLQSKQQSMSTADFVDAIVQSLELDLSNVNNNITLTTALSQALIIEHYSLRAYDEIVYNAIKDWLMQQDFDYTSYKRYKAILAADYPMPSTLNPKKIAVWRSTSKMGDWDKRQAVSVRKWIGSTLKELTDEQAEDLAQIIDAILAPLKPLDVRHHSSFEFDAWERAYSSDKIRSCMHPDSSSEVGSYRTFICYCSGYHGLPDNGLNLTVLYQDDVPVARAITYTDDEQKYYIRVYGDGRLDNWLINNGYDQADFADGTILYTTERLLKPYVDGELCSADHCTTNDGKHYWVLDSDGEYNLQTTYAYASLPYECECCGGSYSEASPLEVESIVNGHCYTVCLSCEERNSYYVYTGYSEPDRVFCHDGHNPATNRGYVECNDEYYETASLGEYDLILIDDEVYHKDDLYYCEMTNEYFTGSDDVYTAGEQISTDQPVHFPYDCISEEYWNDNVVECDCGTLALEEDTDLIGTPSLGDVIVLDKYWAFYNGRNGAGDGLKEFVFKLDGIEWDYDFDPTDKMKSFRDYAIAFNKIQYLRFQELGI